MSSSKPTCIELRGIIMDIPKKKGYHRHHIIPRHIGGDDSKENLIYLTPEEHAEAHWKLWEEHGRYEDIMAFNYLKKANDARGKGYKQSEDHIAKRIASMDYKRLSEKLKERYRNQPHHSLGNKNGRPSEETIEKIKEATKGKKKNNEKGLMGGKREKYSHGNYTLMCIGCKEPVSPSRLNRHGKCRV